VDEQAQVSQIEVHHRLPFLLAFSIYERWLTKMQILRMPSALHYPGITTTAQG
jgi:hypothetical protein